MYKNEDTKRFQRKTNNLLYEFDTDIPKEHLANDLTEKFPDTTIIVIGKYKSMNKYKYPIYIEFNTKKDLSDTDTFILQDQRPSCKNKLYKLKEYLQYIYKKDQQCYLKGIKLEDFKNDEKQNNEYAKAIIALKKGETTVNELWESKPVMMSIHGRNIKNYVKGINVRKRHERLESKAEYLSNYKPIPIDKYRDNEGHKILIKNYNSRIVYGKKWKRNTIISLFGDDTTLGKNLFTEYLGKVDDVYYWSTFDGGFQPNWDSTKDYKIIVFDDFNEADGVSYKFFESIANNTPIEVKKKFDAEPDFITPGTTIIITSNSHLHDVFKKKNPDIIDARAKYAEIDEPLFDIICDFCDIHGIEKPTKDESSDDTDEYLELNLIKKRKRESSDCHDDRILKKARTDNGDIILQDE